MVFKRNRGEGVAVTSGGADARALSEVIAALQGLLERPDNDLHPLLETVRTSFGMDYGSAWARHDEGWRCIGQTGSLGQDFAELTARFVDPGDNSDGVTSCGAALGSGGPVFVDDTEALDEPPQACERGKAASRAGARAAFSFPVIQQGRVRAVFDFMSRTPLPTSPAREATLSALADVIALTFRLREQTLAQAATAKDRSAVTTVVSRIGACKDEESALAVALDTVRDAFGWGYGSFWALDEEANVLRFAQESGSAGEEFRRVTLAASFAEGVGLSGRAWRARDLVYVPDLGQIHDCVRAPVAQKVGVKAGACFPILVEGRVVGTMDFFSTESIALS
ncbi:MAG: GAF domain-containing protein, partial [Janthinobacterium lividum]